MRFYDTTSNFSYADLCHLLSKWREAYPQTVQMPIGMSVMGQPIELFRVGNGPKHVQIQAAMHANEWLTSFALVQLAMDICEYLYDAHHDCVEEHHPWSILQSYSLWMVPLVNPDGVQLVMDGRVDDEPMNIKVLAMNEKSLDFSQWKANIRGVDLNDQFPAGWDIERTRRQSELLGKPYIPGPRDYCGTKPLSEPEAQALVALTERIPFATTFALHSQGEEIYYHYRGYEPLIAKTLAEEMAIASGYRAVRLTDSDAGFKDWFIAHYRRPAFTVELGRGVNPLPLAHLPDICHALQSIILSCLHGLPNVSLE